jgi:Xaa-Pro aminopeptidase
MMQDQRRIAQLQERMRQNRIGLAVIGPTSNLLWLTGLNPHDDERPVLLIMGPGKAGLLVPAVNAASQRAQTSLPFYSWADGDGPMAALRKLLGDVGEAQGCQHVALDEGMRAGFALLILDELGGWERTGLSPLLGPLRLCKDEEDYAGLKASARLNDGAMRAAFASLRPGITERAAAEATAAFFGGNDALPESVSVCFGENGAFPHHHSGSRVLRPDDCVLIDLCGRRGLYPSDMTRVVAIGNPLPSFLEIAALVERALGAALAAVRPGAQARAIDHAARSIIGDAGYGAFFVHRTGHGLGLDIHEPPYISAESDTVIEEGMVFSIEPGIYLDGRFGVRLEELVMVRGGRAEILSELPRDLTRLNPVQPA